jgi:hypothetical protein
MDTRLFISKNSYTTSVFTKDITYTSGSYVLSPDGTYTDVAVDEWHYGYVNYVSGYGWQPMPSNITDTMARTSYWDLGINGPTTIDITLDINCPSTPDGAIELGCGNVFYTINTSGGQSISLSPSTPDPTYGYKLVFRGSGGTYLPGNATNLYIAKITVKYNNTVYDPQYREVDLYDDIDIPVTYNVADVADISKKDSNWSLTVKLPNTQNNAQLFDLVDNIGIYGSTFEMLKQYPAFVEVGCNRTFEGYFKLTKVIINDDREVSYEGSLYSNVMEFINRLGSTTLRGNANPADDLSFSEYSTVLDADTLYDKTDMFIWEMNTDPWTVIGEKPYGRGWYCAIVDKYNFNVPQYAKRPVTYGPLLPPTNVYPLYYDQLTPYLFYKEIWDKLFKWAGFNYVSGFIDGSNNPTTFDFSHLAYPDLQWESVLVESYTRVIQDDTHFVTPNSIVQRYWSINRSLPYPLDECTGYVDCYSNPNNELRIDEVGVNVSTFGTFFHETINKGGYYTLNADIPFDVWLIATNYDGSTDQTFDDTCEFDDSVEWFVKLELILKRGGVSTVIQKKEIRQNYEENYEFSLGRYQIVEPDSLKVENKNLYLEAGDEIFLKFDYSFPNGGDVDGFYSWVARRLNPPTLMGVRCNLQFLKSEQDAIQYELKLINDFEVGSLYDPTAILDPKESKVDFVTNIIRKFNLYIEDVTDKRDENGVYYRDYPGIRQSEPILRIEPRNHYYSGNPIVRDWTSKTDVDTIEFNRIDNYVYKLIDLNDDNDKTFYTEDYANYLYPEGEFGEKKLKSPFNTSADEKCEIKTKLGQTMVDNYRSECKFRQVPKLFTFTDIATGEIKTDKHYDTRMLFVNNINGADWTELEPDNELIGLFFHSNGMNAQEWDNPDTDTNRPPFASYILLSHFNIPFGGDTADLNFWRANWYYQNLLDTQPTDNNAYNVFYRDMIDEYNSPEARLMKCKMYLKSSDIRDLQLSDTIIVNSVAYHINKIKQWKNEYSPVEVELIKIIQSGSFQGQPILKSVKNAPKISLPVPTAVIRDEVEGLTKLVDENKDELSKNTKAIDEIQNLIKKLDERLQKLEKM